MRARHTLRGPNESGRSPCACPSSQLAAMSTTTELKVAASYSASACSLLFMLRTTSFMDRGADLSYLSCFPGEAEYLYPPLTYLQPTSRRETILVGADRYTVVEVEPHFAS